jgi:hypothetical protein
MCFGKHTSDVIACGLRALQRMLGSSCRPCSCWHSSCWLFGVFLAHAAGAHLYFPRVVVHSGFIVGHGLRRDGLRRVGVSTRQHICLPCLLLREWYMRLWRIARRDACGPWGSVCTHRGSPQCEAVCSGLPCCLQEFGSTACCCCQHSCVITPACDWSVWFVSFAFMAARWR